MIIKMTCTTNEYQAGLVYNVPDKKARELIDADMAFEVVKPVEEQPVYFEERKTKKVKYDG